MCGRMDCSSREVEQEVSKACEWTVLEVRCGSAVKFLVLACVRRCRHLPCLTINALLHPSSLHPVWHEIYCQLYCPDEGGHVAKVHHDLRRGKREEKVASSVAMQCHLILEEIQYSDRTFEKLDSKHQPNYSLAKIRKRRT